MLKRLRSTPSTPFVAVLSIISKLLWNTLTPEALTRYLKRYNVVSFDVFDTLVFRIYPQPTDVFAQIEAEQNIEEFKKKRISAEEMARRVCDKPCGEINIFDIYNQLSSDIQIDPIKGIDVELNTEKKCCYANPYMKAVFDMLQADGKEIIAVSDMYIPKSYLVNLLTGMGYEGFSNIFVSCDCGCGKSNGELQRLVSKTVGQEKRIIHIGDNFRCDFLASLRNGWHAIWYPKQR